MCSNPLMKELFLHLFHIVGKNEVIWMVEMCLGDYSRFSDNFVHPIFHMPTEHYYILLVL